MYRTSVEAVQQLTKNSISEALRETVMPVVAFAMLQHLPSPVPAWPMPCPALLSAQLVYRPLPSLVVQACVLALRVPSCVSSLLLLQPRHHLSLHILHAESPLRRYWLPGKLRALSCPPAADEGAQSYG